ncbi:SdpI family protein [Chitinophaga sp. Cy-1792]|uniref:SdpI family protein n=1 Tax=Chitinophaga sp. Cy-1792 TaxID=2608339 RepID=UPI0014234398|nr:SdpI family protein [Chitinophaga sp. Cy-1792]NIG54399.1 SdpI family protein [Chitinophaga sp. Cy-1792]
MKGNKWRSEWLSLLIMATPFLVYLWLAPSLPPKIPAHYSFTSHGLVVDRYSAPLTNLLSIFPAMLLLWALFTFLQRGMYTQLISLPQFFRAKYGIKIAVLSLLAAIPVLEMLRAANIIPHGTGEKSNYWMVGIVLLLANALVFAVFKIGQRSISNTAIHYKYYNILWVGSHVVMSAGPLCAIFAPDLFNIEKLIPQLMLVFLAVMGNLLYSVKPNSMLGIRTPWTFSSEVVWRKTHHLGGVLLFAGGLTGFVLSLFLAASSTKYLFISIVLITTLIPVFYSWYLYRQQVNS